MDKPNCEQHKSTEQLILDAAVKEFSVKGFDGARTAIIAAEAGVTHAMLHYYFRTKERLFKHVFEEKIKDVMNLVCAPILNMDGRIKDRLRKGIEAHFDLLTENSSLPVFFVTTLNSRPELYTDFITGLTDAADERISSLQREFDKAYEAGEIRKVDVAMLFGDIAALNIFPFLATPMLMAATGFEPGRREEFLAARKKETVEMILSRIS